MDDRLQRHLCGRGLLYLLRGLAGALLLPVVSVLRLARRARWPVWVSWLCSAVICAGGWRVWVLWARTAADGRSRAGELLGLGLAICAAAVVSGRLQQADYSAAALQLAACAEDEEVGRTCQGHRHHLDHHRGHDQRRFRHHHLHGHERRAGRPGQPGLLPNAPAQDGNGAASERPEPSVAMGVCTGECRSCQRAVCAKTGRARQQVSR